MSARALIDGSTFRIIDLKSSSRFAERTVNHLILQNKSSACYWRQKQKEWKLSPNPNATTTMRKDIAKDMKLHELKPCPFCGGEAKLSGLYIIGKTNAWAVYCGNSPSNFTCGAQITSITSEEDAVQNWNRRANDES